MNTRLLLPLISALVFTSACVTASMSNASGSRDAAVNAKADTRVDTNACAWFSSIDDWMELDNRNLIVWVSRNEVYHVELSTALFDLDAAPSIAFVDHNRDGRLCGYGMDEVVVPRSSIFGSSTIVAMTRLDDDGLAQLAEKYKVKLAKPKTKPNADAAKN